MIIINEQKSGSNITYSQTILDDCGKTITSSTIIFSVSQVILSSKIYWVLYDANMVPVPEVFNYLNVYMADKADNSRSKAAHALKFLYCFQAILGKSLETFTLSDISSLQEFMLGRNRNGNYITYENLSERSPDTVNGYLSVYRDFLRFQGKNNAILMERSSRSFRLFEPTMNDIQQNSYRVNLYSKRNKEVPMYISVEEYKSIIQKIKKDFTVRDECIVRLMYECGLRIGEVLGLTNEDIRIEIEDHQYYCVLYLRNRNSDKPYQHVKNLMHVTSPKQYSSRAYNTPDIGYQTTYISADLYELISQYIEEEHTLQRKKHPDNYQSSAIADSVYNDSEENFYIFLNSLGRPLSQSLWNKTLRKIFQSAGINVDIGVREHNLNHRFRHGFAMFQIQRMNLKEVNIAALMRHRSPRSTMRYFRPTITDQIRIKTKFADTLRQIVPDLSQDNTRKKDV